MFPLHNYEIIKLKFWAIRLQWILFIENSSELSWIFLTRIVSFVLPEK